MYLLSRVTWYRNGRTDIEAKAVGTEIDEIDKWLAFNYPDTDVLEYLEGLDLWRTSPVNYSGTQVLWSVSKIDEIRG